MNKGLVNYLAQKKARYGITPPKAVGPVKGIPTLPLHPQMVSAIKQSPKGKLPPGLLKYLASKKKGGKK